MPTPTIEFSKPCVVVCGDCPVHIFEELQHAIEDSLWALPGWVEQVRVQYDASDDGTFAMQAHEEYRTVYLIVNAGFGRVSRAERPRFILHEFIHAHLNAMDDFWRDLVGAMDPPEAMKNWAKNRWRRALEIATNDLERAIWNRQEALRTPKRRMRA